MSNENTAEKEFGKGIDELIKLAFAIYQLTLLLKRHIPKESSSVLGGPQPIKAPPLGEHARREVEKEAAKSKELFSAQSEKVVEVAEVAKAEGAVVKTKDGESVPVHQVLAGAAAATPEFPKEDLAKLEELAKDDTVKTAKEGVREVPDVSIGLKAEEGLTHTEPVEPVVSATSVHQTESALGKDSDTFLVTDDEEMELPDLTDDNLTESLEDTFESDELSADIRGATTL